MKWHESNSLFDIYWCKGNGFTIMPAFFFLQNIFWVGKRNVIIIISNSTLIHFKFIIRCILANHLPNFSVLWSNWDKIITEKAHIYSKQFK